jgi:hypothetical protein
VRPALGVAFAAFIVSGLDASQIPIHRYAWRGHRRLVVTTTTIRLSGITAVDVVVSEMNANACGLSRAALQDSAVTALRAAGTTASVSAKASSWFYTVYVTAESSAADGRCVTAVRAELMAQVSGIPEADRFAPQDGWGSLLVGEMPLVRQSAMVNSSRTGHAAQVDAVVREQVTAIGARIKAVNQPRLSP